MKNKSDLLKLIRSGVRLKTKPPKRETPKNVYRRRDKHRRRFDKDPSFFISSAAA